MGRRVDSTSKGLFKQGDIVSGLFLLNISDSATLHPHMNYVDICIMVFLLFCMQRVIEHVFKMLALLLGMN
jgi:hypothetical protein